MLYSVKEIKPRFVELPTETIMRLRNEDLERCYQLVMKRIAEYDLDDRDQDSEYRTHLMNQKLALLKEFLRRRYLV